MSESLTNVFYRDAIQAGESVRVFMNCDIRHGERLLSGYLHLIQSRARRQGVALDMDDLEWAAYDGYRGWYRYDQPSQRWYKRDGSVWDGVWQPQTAAA